MAIRSFKERNTVTVTARFVNASGATTNPTSVRYRVDCETNQRTILDWTQVTAAPSVSLSIPAASNVLINQRNKTERKVVTVEANFDTPYSILDIVKYDVLNLQAVP